MKDYRSLLVSFVEIVTFLLAAFGGFLRRIAPPDQVRASYPVGILAFLMLGTLLVISAIGRIAHAHAARKKWVVAGIALFLLSLPASFLYPSLLSHYTYPQQAELQQRQVAAPDKYLTSDARQFRFANPDASAEDLTRNLPDGDVWSREGIERTESLLLAAYACLVMALSGGIFCLLEANVVERKPDSSDVTTTK